MNFSEYQQAAHKFATYGESGEMYPALGLSEEAGEVNGKIAKFLRKNKMLPFKAMGRKLLKAQCDEFREAISKELGDTLWMLAEVATVYGLDLGTIAQENIDKLTDRKERDVIVGEGDDR